MVNGVLRRVMDAREKLGERGKSMLIKINFLLTETKDLDFGTFLIGRLKSPPAPIQNLLYYKLGSTHPDRLRILSWSLKFCLAEREDLRLSMLLREEVR